jgi:hypothetical protein
VALCEGATPRSLVAEAAPPQLRLISRD